MTGRIVDQNSVARRARRWLVGGGLRLGIGGVLAAVAAAGAVHWGGLPTYEVPVPAYELPTDVDPQRGRQLATMLCWSCHFDPTTGALSGRELSPRLAVYGHVYSANLTKDEEAGIGTWSPGEVAFLLRSGVHPRTGEYVPPYMPKFPRVADADLADLIAFLRSDDPWVAPVATQHPDTVPSFQTKLLARTRWAPLPAQSPAIEAPASSDPDAYGAYLVNDLLQCYRCHSADPTDVDFSDPAATSGYLAGGARLRDENGRYVHATNLTKDPTGLKDWSYEEFRTALVDGVGRAGRSLRWPMPRYMHLGEREVEGMFAYVQSTEAVRNSVPDPEAYKGVPAMLEPGKFEFQRLACQTCHPDQATGLGQFDELDEHFASDEQLAAFILDPRSVYASSAMPGYADRLDDEALAKLVKYLRKRSEPD